MSQIVVKVEDLSKRYQLGTIGYGSLQRDLSAWWAKLRNKEDPNATIGQKSRLDAHGEFWALRQVGFEIPKGDRVGIIGRNGAGKSTLLKLLSRVTGPTTGTIKVRGRIASLLEVGTGFHPELTGRENVFLNGAILGMKRREIQARFDEIVAFADVGEFIDTPVKRYSSGMYVKLAFSVAAHLDSEILIIDEVLAVGDAAFQKKSIEKMDQLARENGRTILFVSHQIPFLLKLCNKGILLNSGRVEASGPINDVVAEYLRSVSPQGRQTSWENRGENLPYKDIFVPKRFYLAKGDGSVTTTLTDTEPYFAHIEIDIVKADPRIGLALFFYDSQSNFLFNSELFDTFPVEEMARHSGRFHCAAEIPEQVLLSKTYKVELVAYLLWEGFVLPPDNHTKIEFAFMKTKLQNWYGGDARPGSLYVPMTWKLEADQSPEGKA